MNDTPPICINCDCKILEIKPVEYRVDLVERCAIGVTLAYECQACGTHLMNSEQMDNLLKELRIYKKKQNTND